MLRTGAALLARRGKAAAELAKTVRGAEHGGHGMIRSH